MISIQDLHLTYREGGTIHHALRGVSLELAQGKFLTLLGPSGCGKTTLLRCIAGLETPDSGRILIDNEPVFAPESGNFVPPAKRNLGMVFQSYAIWPHMSVFDNVVFPLRYRTTRKGADAKDRVMFCLHLVKLDHLAERPAPMLSGGQQQRLALARALAAEPKLLLLDEPLSNLDARLREDMRFELRQIVQRAGVTTIFVTHEQTEALSMSDVVAVMNDGEIVQSGDPRSLYNRPLTEFVANFMVRGNRLAGRATTSASATEPITIGSPIGDIICLASIAIPYGTAVSLLLRPETIDLLPATATSGVPGTIESAAFMGDAVEYAVRIDNTIILAKRPGTSAFQPGDAVRVTVAPRENITFPIGGITTQTPAHHPAFG
jgi:iron(III) transport system ATP-binding protein